MTNEEIINYKDKTSLPREMCDFITKNYTKVSDGTTVEDAHWETACMIGNDWKYGRFKIDTAKQLWRGLSFNEFYIGGVVD